MTGGVQTLFMRPYIWSFVGAGAVWLAAVAFTGGYGAGGMLTAALSLSVFTVVVGVGQMFVITLGPGNVDLSLPANIGLASAVAMKTMGGDDRMVIVGLAAAIACGLLVGLANYLLIWARRFRRVSSSSRSTSPMGAGFRSSRRPASPISPTF